MTYQELRARLDAVIRSAPIPPSDSRAVSTPPTPLVMSSAWMRRHHFAPPSLGWISTGWRRLRRRFRRWQGK